MNKNEDAKCSRRGFLKGGAAVVSSLAVLPVLTHAQGALAEAGAQAPLDPEAPTAKALGYVHDATKVDTAKFPKRKSPEGDNQFCSNCALMTEQGIKLADHPGEWGKCSIFPQGLVNVDGWCNSWIEKPAA